MMTALSSRGALKGQACVLLDSLGERLVELSHALHDHPELAYHELRSSSTIADFARDHGMRVRHPAHGLSTAFRATAGTRGPAVFICCEYDALPGLGHACGHNVVAACGIGAAVVLGQLAQAASGRVVALGTPAEEGGGGKIQLLDRGAFSGATAVLLVHPGNVDSVAGHFRAAGQLRVEFLGRASHAAMAAQNGRNALDAALLTYQALAVARPALVFGDQLSAIVSNGGQAVNVIPDRAVLAVMTRSTTTRGLDQLTRRVRTAAAAGALATRCSYRLRRSGPVYNELRTDPALARMFASNLRRLGRAVTVQGDRELLSAGSTDLGNVSQIYPAIHPKLAISSCPQHSKDFARAARSAAGDRAVLAGAKALALTAIDVWLETSMAPGGRAWQ